MLLQLVGLKKQTMILYALMECCVAKFGFEKHIIVASRRC